MPMPTPISCCSKTANIAEAQATAEGATYDEEALLRLLRLARIGCTDIFAAQARAVAK